MSSPEQVVLLLADISGYTRFMLSHQKALAHSHMIIQALLNTITAQAEPPLEVSKLEGDAVLMFVRKDGERASVELGKLIGERIARLFEQFAVAVENLAETSICKCEACSDIAKLRLKLFAHSGEAVLSKFGNLTELTGVDVIVVHRLLKNGIDRSEYVFVTDSAQADISLPPRCSLAPHKERYDDLGTISGAFWDCPCERTADGSVASEPRPAADDRLAWEILRYEIQKEYAEVATNPDKGFHFHTGRRLALMLGYDERDIDAVPITAVESLAGTGNPHSLGEMPPGSTVVDIGCGAGFDTFIAARRVGPTGRVIGVDMTADMIAKARAAAEAGGYDNVQILEGYAEALPVPDGWADFVISNGVLNLCPNKPAALREMRRVLKPGGMLYIGDIIVEKPVPEKARRNLDLWTG
jgi:arsenite methyltransferase